MKFVQAVLLVCVVLCATTLASDEIPAEFENYCESADNERIEFLRKELERSDLSESEKVELKRQYDSFRRYCYRLDEELNCQN